MRELMGISKVDRHDAANALGVDVRWRDLLSERERRKNRQLGARIEAIDIGAGIGLGIPQLLSLVENGFEAPAALLDRRKDVVAGAVQDAEQRRDAIAGDALAQHGMDRNAAADARFHGDIDSGADTPLPNLAAACAINSLFAVTTDFFSVMAASIISFATTVPPTSSATISTAG